jgi:hypothetical protein
MALAELKQTMAQELAHKSRELENLRIDYSESVRAHESTKSVLNSRTNELDSA